MSACVAFGPNDSHLFNSPKQWSMNGLPAGMNALFNGQSKIKEIHEVALGANGSYILTYSHHAGMSLLHSGLPAGLERWLIPVPGNGVTRDIPSLQVVLGPGDAYFAFDKNGSSWGDLPKPLSDAVEARRDATGRFRPNEGPASVALGPDGAYVFITTGGGGVWNLYHQNDILQQFLRDRPSLHGVHVMLSPCRPGIYITLLTDGSCAGSVLTTQYPQYEALAADWKLTCLTHPQPALRPVPLHTHSSSSSVTTPLTAQYGTSPISATSAISTQYRSSSAPVLHPAPMPYHHHPMQHMPTPAQVAHRPQPVHHATAPVHHAPAHHRASSAFTPQNLKQGLKLAGGLLNVANSLDGNGGGGGDSGGDSGGFDTVDFSSDTTYVDTSDMWSTDQSAAIDPIQQY